MKLQILLFFALGMISSCIVEDSNDPFNYSGYSELAQPEYHVNFTINNVSYSIVQEYGVTYPSSIGGYFIGGKWHIIAIDTTSSGNRFKLDLEFNNYTTSVSASRKMELTTYPANNLYSNMYLNQSITGTSVSVNLTKYTTQKQNYFEGTFSGIIANTDSLTPAPVAVIMPLIINGNFKVQYK